MDPSDRHRYRHLFIKRRHPALSQLARAVEALSCLASPAARGRTFLDIEPSGGIAALLALRHHGFADALVVEGHPDRRRLVRLNAVLNGVAGRVQVVDAVVAAAGARPRREVSRLSPSVGEKMTVKCVLQTSTVDALVDADLIDPRGVSLAWLAGGGDHAGIIGSMQTLFEAGVPVVVIPDREQDATASALTDVLVDACARFVDLGAAEGRFGAVEAASALPAVLARDVGARGASGLLLLPGSALLARRAGPNVREDRRAEYRRIVQARRSEPVVIDQPLALISQPHGSGGTLLKRLFDGHPQCHTMPDELVLNWQATAGGSRSEPIAAAATAAGDTRDAPMRPASLQQAIFADQLARYRVPTPRAMMNSFFTAYFNAWLDYQRLPASDKRWVTALRSGILGHEHEDELRIFAQTYPDGHLITIVRDPRGWFAASPGHGAGDGEIESVMASWSASVRHVERLADVLGDRLIVLSLEDLVARTHAVMHDLAGLLGIDFASELCIPTRNTIAITAGAFEAPGARVLTEDQTECIDDLAGALHQSTLERFVRPLGSKA